MEEDPQLLFSREEWMTEDQIKSFFGRLAAQKRFNLKDGAPTEAQVRDADQDLCMAEHTQQQIDMRVNYNSRNLFEHPLEAGGINLCALAKSAATTRRRNTVNSDIHDYSIISKK